MDKETIEKLISDVKSLKEEVEKLKGSGQKPLTLKLEATLTDNEENVIGYFSQDVAQNCE